MRPPDTIRRYFQTAQDWVRRTTSDAVEAPTSHAIQRESGLQPTSRAAALYDEQLELHTRRYEVLDKLGQGGIGVVYRAYDRELGRHVALKTLRTLTAEHLLDLKQEFRALTDLLHPNLVELYELHADAHDRFLTMELVEGSDFVTHVRRNAESSREGFVESFRNCAFQLASGIHALHRAGKLHRDIKPSNVIVTRAGRVVLLDFGLVTPLATQRADQATIAGTLEYMAPEQAWGAPLTEAADWYSFGVTLFQAATGSLPHEARSFTRFSAPRATGPRLVDVAPWLDSELTALVDALLRIDPSGRPNAQRVLATCGGIHELQTSISVSDDAATCDVFTNRVSELHELFDALFQVRSGHTRIVLLKGVSGIGKSELASRFVALAHAQGATVLASRCNPRETIAFNAADGLIDTLSHVCAGLYDTDLARIDAQHWSALVRLFPVLESLRSSEPVAEQRDAGAEYRRALRALRQIVSILARRGPLILWVDDAQWADLDSGELLRDLIRTPDQAPLMLLITYRSDAAAVGGLRAALEADVAAIPTSWHRTVTLGPLTLEDSREMLHGLLSREAVPSEQNVARWLNDAAGSPFFLRELARQLRSTDAASWESTSLRSVLRRRLDGLHPSERKLLDVTAVAGGRLEHRILVRAADLEGLAQPFLNTLRRLSLIRSSRLDGELCFEIQHSLIRDQSLSVLGDQHRRALHRRIADAMVASGNPQLARTVEQYEAAEDWEAVRRYIVPAANHAAASLAFELAARLYQRAIDIGGTGTPDLALLRRLAECHAQRGYGAEAGRAYERAAAEAQRGGDRRQFAECWRLASEQYLQSGENGAGMRLLESTLATHHINLPSSRRAAMAQLLFYRARIALRRGDFMSTPEALVAVRDLDKLDTIWLVWRTMSVVDHTLAIAFSARYLFDALHVGEPSRVLRGLAAEATALSTMPGKLFWPRIDAMLQQVDGLCEAAGDPNLRAGFHQCRGITAWFRGKPQEALEALDTAVRMYRRSPYGTTFDISQCETFRLPALALLGHVSRLRTELQDALTDAHRRSDRYLTRNIAAGFCSLGWIAGDDVAVARDWAERVLAQAPDKYSTQHYQYLQGEVQAALYEGRGEAAWYRMAEHWPRLVRNHFVLLSFNGEDLRRMRGHAALAFAAELPRQQGGRLGKRARALLQVADREAKTIRSRGLSLAQPWAATLEAGAALLRGRREQAIGQLRAALGQFEEHGLQLYAAATQWTLGGMEGTSGERTRREAEEWMLAEGVVKPASMVRMLVPVFEVLPELLRGPGGPSSCAG